jgi:hypothetical protein
MELVGIVARNLWLRHDTIMVHGKLVSPYSTVISNAYDTLVSFHNVNSCKYPLKLAGNLELCWHAPQMILSRSIKKTWHHIGLHVIVDNSSSSSFFFFFFFFNFYFLLGIEDTKVYLSVEPLLSLAKSKSLCIYFCFFFFKKK